MVLSLSAEQVRLLRTRSQRLDAQGAGEVRSAAEIVRELCGVQAQDGPAAALSVRVPGAGLTAARVEHERVQTRTLVRTWAMRGTLHLIAAEDLGWLLPLLGPVFIRADRRRGVMLGLNEETYAAGLREIRMILAATDACGMA